MKISILPSAIVDIVRIRCFYDGLEIGLGTRFQDYIFGEIDKLEDNAGIDEVHFGYYRALANHDSLSRCFCSAIDAASARVATPSFAKITVRCFLTLTGDIPNWTAIS